MKLKLKSLAVAVAALFGTGTASAQEWAPAGYQPPAVVAPYGRATPVAYQGSPSDASCVAGCTDKAGGCASGACSDGSCEECRDPRGLWGGFEFLFLWHKGRDLPPLVTSSPGGTPEGAAGVLPGADILFGGDRVGDQMQAAGRLTAGLYFDEEESIGFGVRILGTEGDKTSFTVNSPDTPIFARPFFNIDPLVNQQDALVIAYPGQLAGDIAVNTSSDLFQSDALFRINFDYGPTHRFDLIAGYQFTRLDDGVDILSNSTIVGLGPLVTNPIGSTFSYRDTFDAKNEFHGGALGFWYEHYRGPWVVSTLAKFSIGQMSQSLLIDGSNTSNTGGGPVTGDGGLLAQPLTNMGTYKRHKTAFVPELALNLNRRLTDHIDLSVGYSIIYFSSVVLAGDQIDTVVNGSQLNNGPLLGPARPAFPGFNDSDYFVHGLSLGLNVHF